MREGAALCVSLVLHGQEAIVRERGEGFFSQQSEELSRLIQLRKQFLFRLKLRGMNTTAASAQPDGVSQV